MSSATVTGTHPITKADRYGLLAALLDESIASEYFTAIDRLLYSLRRGRVEVTNQLSLVSV
ncbi:hypothetical protein [Microcoleus sp. FACHB-68]|uniref:hypothetical protein n=1 Tax=Microcoleus sp. FACHB-68 TaxID=2692826 RepID=UPI001F5516B8|nr:hypothetical protein [Microcoleus sp. FACHB-68]